MTLVDTSNTNAYIVPCYHVSRLHMPEEEAPEAPGLKKLIVSVRVDLYEATIAKASSLGLFPAEYVRAILRGDDIELPDYEVPGEDEQK